MKNKLTTYLQPINLLRIQTVVYVLLAIAAAFLMSDAPKQIRATYPGKDLLASQATTQFVPAVRPLFDLSLQWMLIALLLISAVFAGVHAFRLRKDYEDNIKGRTSFRRWLYIAVTGALAIEIVSLLVGIQDIVTLKLIGGFIVVSALMGWRAEVDNAQGPGRRAEKFSFVLEGITGALPWLAIIATLVFSAVFALVRLPWYAYAASLAIFLGAVLVYWNQMNQIRQYRSWKDYGVVERNYLLIDLAAKLALAVILIVGLPK